MPARWWAPLDPTQSAGASDSLVKAISAQLQIIHYNLLTVLHLPYLLWNSDDSRYEYSKATCIHASRQALTRWIRFRSIVYVVYSCRPVDFCAFTAAITLLLAYINSREGTTLTHQRLGDRALIETALETMDQLSRLNDDELTKKTAELTRRLLDIEAECALSGPMYNTAGEHNPAQDKSDALHLGIPYFGTVRLASDGSSPAPLDTASYTSSSNQYSTWSSSPSFPFNSSQIHPPLQPQYIPLDGSHTFPGYSGYDMQMADPNAITSAEDWAFQGVDATLFSTVFSGHVPVPIADENWGNYMHNALAIDEPLDLEYNGGI